MCTGESIQNWLLLTSDPVYFLGLLRVPGTEWIVVPVSNGKGCRSIVPSAIVLLLLASTMCSAYIKTLEFLFGNTNSQVSCCRRSQFKIQGIHSDFWATSLPRFLLTVLAVYTELWVMGPRRLYHALKLALLNNGQYYLFLKFTNARQKLISPKSWRTICF